MDKKYIIDLDRDGLINYVGINTPEGLVVKKITDKHDATKYMNQMREINKEYGHFFRNYFDGKCEIASGRFFEEEMRKEYVKEEPVPEITEKVNSKSIKQIAALALAFIVGTSAIALAKDGNIVAKAKKALGFQKQTTIQAADENEEESLETKTLDELISMLNKGDQQEAFNKIIDVQDYFNEVAAPTVGQEDKQLYLTFDETVALYVYANSHAKSIEDFQKIFGKSKIILLNPETNEYEEMTAETIAANYLSACLNLNYYYQLGATETSGISKIFENEKEAELFDSFESKLLAYNKKASKELAAEIREQYEKTFMSGNIDSALDKYPGASSLILTGQEPTVYLKGILSDSTHKSLTEINETLTCQKIYNERIQPIFSICKQKENGKEAIIEEIAKRQDQTVMGLDRNVDLSEAISGYRASELDTAQLVTGYAGGFDNSKTITKHVKTVTKSRSKAIKATSKSQVVKAEKQANKKIEEKNRKEEKRAEKLIKENEKNDEKSKEKQRKEYDEKHKNDKPKEIVTEETWVHEDTPQNPEPDKPTPSESDIEVVEEYHEDTTIHGTKPEHNSSNTNSSSSSSNSNSSSSSSSSSNSNSSSSSSTEVEVREEVVEDTHIYGEKPKAQKVVKVERHEEVEEEAKEENTEDANVRVRQ